MKLLIDECIGKPLFEKLADILALADPNLEWKHLTDIVKAGTKDDVWVPELSSLGYIVITGDTGKGSGAPLPYLLPRHQMTAIFFSGKIQQRRAFEKVRSIIYLWPDIMAIADDTPGKRWKIMIHGTGYRWEEWPLQE